MKYFAWLVSFALTATTGQIITFDSAAPGRLPSGWISAAADTARAPKWEVIRDAGAPSQPNVLAHLSQSPAGAQFPLAIYNSILADGTVGVRFKPVSSQTDEVAGVVWRYVDPDNYYTARVDATDRNVAVYKVQNGRRIPLVATGRSGRKIQARYNPPANLWGTLKVNFEGPLFSVYVNHRRVLQVRDSTFVAPGKVGLWTEAGGITYFDDFRVIRR